MNVQIVSLISGRFDLFQLNLHIQCSANKTTKLYSQTHTNIFVFVCLLFIFAWMIIDVLWYYF